MLFKFLLYENYKYELNNVYSTNYFKLNHAEVNMGLLDKKIDEMLNKYKEQSTYYCYELIKIEDDGSQKLIKTTLPIIELDYK